MRHVYLDEAGISQGGTEPFIVVAGALVNPDRHWHDVTNYYNDLAQTVFTPEEYDPETHGNFVFHAKDVWHGSGLFPRDRFSLQERMRLFHQLAQAPDLLGIPICYGMLDKNSLSLPAHWPETYTKVINHCIAFVIALQEIDAFMERHCKGQVAMITAEDTDQVREALQLFLRSPQTNGRGFSHESTIDFRTRSIVDSIRFAKKPEAPIMQMADHCAFTIRRSKSSCQFIGRHLEKMRPAFAEQLVKARSVTLRAPEPIVLRPTGLLF